MWGIRSFCHFCPEECGALVIVGDSFLIQGGGDRSHRDFWVHFGAMERTQVFTPWGGTPYNGL